MAISAIDSFEPAGNDKVNVYQFWGKFMKTDVKYVSSLDDLNAIYGDPMDLVKNKTLPKLEKHCRAFIALSPFLTLATSGADGMTDVSPRGDAPGFVAVWDDNTLVIPDRPGNKRVDSMTNIVENPNVGLLFFVPGMNETLRINGKARITDDPALLAPLAVRGRAPAAGIVVQIEEAFLHCAKACIRSKLWHPDSQIERKSFPTLGKMIADQLGGLDADAADEMIEQDSRENLY
jgi:hypothetical protein